MFWRTTKVGRNALLLLGLIGLLALIFVESSLHSVKQRWFVEKLEAARLAAKAQQTIRQTADTLHIIIDPITDPNATGLVGEQFTLITTDQGDLDSKLTSTNPNWAGVVVEMLKRAGVERGDYVAVSYTGSMPAMNIAALSAIEVMGVTPVIISSIGSSMWGANNPDFTWLDMERMLYEKGIFHYRSIATSIGGRGDYGGNLSPEGREHCRKIALRNNIPLIDEKTLDNAIQRRYELFQSNLPKGNKYSVYINVGGGLASVGSLFNLELLPPGLLKKLPPYNYPIRGTMILFAEKGIPLIDLRDIQVLAKQYNLPISPQPLPNPPAGGVFYKNFYRTELVAIILVLYAILTFVIIRFDIISYMKRRRSSHID